MKRWLFVLLVMTGCSSLIGVSGDVSEIRTDPDADAAEAGADAQPDSDATDEPD